MYAIFDEIKSENSSCEMLQKIFIYTCVMQGSARVTAVGTGDARISPANMLGKCPSSNGGVPGEGAPNSHELLYSVSGRC